MPDPMPILRPGAIYAIELCSGERCRWQYLGAEREVVRWRDLESGREFDEASLMYAWKIVGSEDAL
jgi:hypothetical protein